MSYDLEIRSNDTYSEFTSFAALADFIGELDNVFPNGERCFARRDALGAWMEIDLEVVNVEGDNIEEPSQEYPDINRVSLHIPYSVIGEDRAAVREIVAADYLPTARDIAKHLGWKLFDNQLDEYLPLA